MKPLKIISGGQTGVDRAALDVALELDIPHGGWCPKGRLAEDGPLHGRYVLTETGGTGYTARTRYNVRDSDATLILTYEHANTPGTNATVRICRQLNKPRMSVFLYGEDGSVHPDDVRLRCLRQFFTGEAVGFCPAHPPVRTLNIAGPRESKCPGIYEAARAFLLEVLR